MSIIPHDFSPMNNRSRTKTTQWNLVSRFLSIVLAILAGIVMVPLYLKHIPLEIYGAWLASGNMLAWLSIVDPGLTVVLQQRVAAAYGKRDFSAISDILGGGVLIAVVIMLVAAFFGFVCAQYLPGWLKLTSADNITIIGKAFSFAVIGTSLMLFSFALSAINLGLQGSLGVGLITNCTTLLSYIFIAILLYNGCGVLAIAVGLILQGIFHVLLQAAYLVWRMKKEKIGITVTLQGCISLMKLLSFTFLGRASGVFANNIDLMITARFLGPETTAVFSLTKKASDISREFINQPSVAFMPAVSHVIGSGEMEKAREVLIRLIRLLFWSLCLILGGLVSFNDDFVRLWVGSELFAGRNINLLICAFFFFNLVTACLGNLCYALGDIKNNSIIRLLQSLLFIPLVIIGTKFLGLVGTVSASIIALCVVPVWYYPRSFSKLLLLSSNDHKALFLEFSLTLFAAALLSFLFCNKSPQNWMGFAIIVCAYCVAYCLFMLMMSPTFRYEIKECILKLSKGQIRYYK